MSETKPVSVPTFTLTPPEVLQPVAQEVAKTAVPLQAETKTAVDDQVERSSPAARVRRGRRARESHRQRGQRRRLRRQL